MVETWLCSLCRYVISKSSLELKKLCNGLKTSVNNLCEVPFYPPLSQHKNMQPTTANMRYVVPNEDPRKVIFNFFQFLEHHGIRFISMIKYANEESLECYSSYYLNQSNSSKLRQIFQGSLETELHDMTVPNITFP
jgi:hypothetical protein